MGNQCTSPEPSVYNLYEEIIDYINSNRTNHNCFNEIKEFCISRGLSPFDSNNNEYNYKRNYILQYILDKKIIVPTFVPMSNDDEIDIRIIHKIIKLYEAISNVS
jgi:hypothetical protein